MDFNEDASSGLFYLQVPPPVVISESMNKSLPSLHSHSPNSVKSSIGSPSIFLGGMTAISNHEHTDNINKSNYHHRPALMDCSSPSFLKHQPRLHHCETACENLHEKSEGENIFWKSAWKEQKNQTERVEYELKKIEQELEDLTLSLFTEANRMVEKEKRARVEMEMKLKQVCLELDEKRLRQTNQLAIESTMQLAEFELFFVQLLDQPFQKLHKLPYMKVCLKLDILPCLTMSDKNDDWIKSWLYTLIHHPCYIEDRKLSHDDSKNTDNATCTSGFKLLCVGCQQPLSLSTHSAYRFRWSSKDPWQWMDQHCRNRSVAVCNFYSFLRHIKQRLNVSRSLSSLYQESIDLRLAMHTAQRKVIQ